MRATAWPTATAPLVCEDNLGAVIVECGRVPVRKALVDHNVDAFWIKRVGNIEQDAIAGTRAARDALAWKYCDVVALICLAGLLRFVSMVAAFPEAGQDASLFIGKYSGTRNDARLRRIGYRNLDDVDTKQCGTDVAGFFVEATG